MVAAMLVVLVFIWLPCSKAQSPVGEPTMSPPAVDCPTVLANVSDCYSFIQLGSNLTVPDKACCPEFAGLLDSNPICLCQLLGNSESYGVDINRALMLPGACNLEIPSLDFCPASSPSLSPRSPPAPPPPSPSSSPPPLPPPAQLPALSPLPPPLPPPAPSPPPPPPPSPDKGSNTTRRVVIIVVHTVGGIILLLMVVFVYVYVRRKRKRKRTPPLDNLDGDIDEISTPESLQYSFSVIRVATNGFSDDNKLGQGGFGSVYKGKLKDGREIAVKRFSQDSGQGEQEFKNEVVFLARLQHRNLVRLLGFSIKGSERLLMYEFVQNASLDQFIFDPEKCIMLDWKRRYKIIVGIARGLLYLHEDSRLRIIHRDLKASNVLLDAEMNPKIADFGMARLFEPDKTWGSTSRIVGTYGYMAPEYLLHGQFSQKSDVFSFGVLVLEIITGQKNHSYQNGELIEDLLTNAWKSWRGGAASSLIDVTMRDGSTFVQEMMRCIHIGLLCVQENIIDRPTMATIVLMLSSFSIILPIPSEPAYLKHTNYTTSKMLLEAYTYNMSDSRELKSKSISSQRSLASDTSMKDLYPLYDDDYLY